MATEAKSFKTGDFMLSKWEEEKELKHSGCQCAWVTITKKMVHGRCFG